MHFLFDTWLGGVICSFIALIIVGTPIINWINKEKKIAQNKAHHLKEELKKHNHNNSSNRS